MRPVPGSSPPFRGKSSMPTFSLVLMADASMPGYRFGAMHPRKNAYLWLLMVSLSLREDSIGLFLESIVIQELPDTDQELRVLVCRLGIRLEAEL